MLLLTMIKISVRGLRNIKVAPVKSVKPFVQIQEYSRYTHRRPASILNEDEIFEVDDTEAEEKLAKQRRRRSLTNTRKRQSASQPQKNDKPWKDPTNDITITEEGAPVYVKLKEDDRIMSSLVMSVRSRKQRNKVDQVLLEGRRLIKDALLAGVKPETIIFSRVRDIKDLPLPNKGVKLYKIPYKTIQLWSSLTHCPGVMGIFKTPELEEKECAPDALPLTIICDNVRDPSNMASIIRASAAVGCERLILMKGCVDLWEPKVLRGASGAHFRLPIFHMQTWDDIDSLISSKADVFVADNNTSSNDKASELSDSESDGSDSDVEEKDTDAQECAASDRDDQERSNSSEVPKDDILESTRVDNSREVASNFEKSTTPDFDESDYFKSEDHRSKIPVIPYYAVKYTENEIILIIGGETEGLSKESLSLVHARNGVRVNVPLSNEIDSLNAGMAMAIIVFEMKKQYLVRQASIK